jgi:signal transduction histidine kinase
VQLLRAIAALVAALFVMRVLRSFQVETKRRIDALQSARLEEVQHREALRSEYLKRVVDVQEAERQRIARELHDETGQALTAIGLGIRGAISTLQNDKKKAATQLRHLEGLIANSLNELQRLIADLRPSHLDDLGLAAALRWYAGELQSHSGLRVAVQVEGDLRPISAPVKTALFRVAQEALVNVVKHAQATSAKVNLVFKDDEVALTIEDDGCGFEPGRVEASGRKSWGLMGMEERAHLLGGVFRLESSIGEGTYILVEMPNNHKEVNNENSTVLGG